MYLEIDEGYWEHPKTLDLCARLGDDQADSFPPRLWKWACRCARDGRLGTITAYAFERVVRYAAADGKCFAAFLASGLLDQNEDGEVMIHNWMRPGRTGHAIAKMEAKAEENRQRRADAKAKHEAERERAKRVPAPYRHRTSTNPSQTRPDTDQTQSSDPDPPLLLASDLDSNGGAKFQPDTAHNLVWAIKAAVEAAQPESGMWAPDTFAEENASRLLVGLGDLRKAMPELQRKIAQFAADPEMRPWTLKKFCDAYNGIGAPKVARAGQGRY